MSEQYEQQQGNEALWTTIFADGHPDLLKQHWLHKKLPTRPRCRMCKAPFKGIGGWLMRRKGKQQNSRNPNFCNACDAFMQNYPGGAEIEMSMLFVDIFRWHQCGKCQPKNKFFSKHIDSNHYG